MSFETRQFRDDEGEQLQLTFDRSKLEKPKAINQAAPGDAKQFAPNPELMHVNAYVQRIVLLGCLFLFALGLFSAAFYVKNPDIWDKHVNFISTSFNKFEDTQKILDKEGFLEAMRAGYCEKLIAQGFDGLRKFKGSWLRIPMAECFLMRGLSREVIDILNPLMSKKSKFQEKLSARGDWGHGMLLLTFSQILFQRETFANDLIGAHCKKWKPTFSCISKLLVLSNWGAVSTAKRGLRYYSKSWKTMPMVPKSFVLIAFALFNDRMNLNKQRNKYFRLALEAVPKDKKIFRSILFMMWGLRSFQEKSVIGFIDRKTREEFGSRNRHLMRWKFSFLKKLSDKKSEKVILGFLKNGEQTFQFRWHLNFIKKFAPMVFMAGHGPLLKPLLDQSLRFFSNFGVAPSLVDEVRLLRVRGAMFKKSSHEALIQLKKFKKMSKRRNLGYVYHHLQALNLLHGAIKTHHIQRALKSVGKSLSHRVTWQSLYLKGEILLRLKRYKSVASVLKQFQFLQRRNQAGYTRKWMYLLNAKYLNALKKPKNAIVFAKKALAFDVHFASALELQAESLDMMGKYDDSGKLRNKIDLRRRQYPLYSSLEGRTSPVGPYVFLNK